MLDLKGFSWKIKVAEKINKWSWNNDEGKTLKQICHNNYIILFDVIALGIL